METILVESKNQFSLGAIEKQLSRDWRVEPSPNDRLVVHSGGNRAYIYTEPGSKGGIDPETDPRESGKFYLLIDYSDIEFAKSLISVLADDPTLIVDNDFGVRLPGDQFVARCKGNPEWDWRTN